MNLEDKKSVTISALRVRQPIGDIYVGSIPAKTLVEITEFDIRSLVSEKEIDTYLGIQRDVDQKRVTEIRQYLRGPDATFPTAVVLAVDDKCVTIEHPYPDDDRYVRLTLSNYPSESLEESVLYKHIARVIDGQHRISGLEGYQETFEVNVSIFVGADISDQASIFATVNLAQTKVNRSLVYDLFDYSRSRSPEKTCHSIVVTLESSLKSPFYHKIKRLGKATPGRTTETLSQATVVAGILQYICKNRLQVLEDRQIGRKGATFPPASSQDLNRLILRPFFVKGRDADIVNVIWNYFDAVKQRWPEAWNSSGTGLILNRTNGFDGLIKFFRVAYLNFTVPGGTVSTSEFLSLFEKATISDKEFTPANFIPGSSGASALATLLRDQTGL